VPNVTLVTLSGFSDIFNQFQANVSTLEPRVKKILVTSRGMVPPNVSGFEIIRGVEPFSFPRNANLGIRAAPEKDDILLMNDDARFTQPGTIQCLQEIAYSQSDIGVLSPHIEGEADNAFQTDHARFPGGLAFCERRLCYICVYLKREVLEAVGLPDERFSGYGFDDQDHCLRVLLSGRKLAVTSEVTVLHGFAGSRCSSSFRRTLANRFVSGREMSARFREKWLSLSIASDVVDRYLRE